MANQIQQLTDWLLTDSQSSGKSVKDLKDKPFSHAAKDFPKEIQKNLTEAVYLKSRRLASFRLLQEKLQSLIDNPKWTDTVKAAFPEATFRIQSGTRIIIEVES